MRSDLKPQIHGGTGEAVKIRVKLNIVQTVPGEEHADPPYQWLQKSEREKLKPHLPMS